MVEVHLQRQENWFRDLKDFLSNSGSKSVIIPGKIFGTNQRNPVKLERKRIVWYLLLRVFWLPLPTFNLWEGDWALGYVSTHIWEVSNISKYAKIPSLKSFDDSYTNSHTKFVILDIKLRFTCGNSILY